MMKCSFILVVLFPFLAFGEAPKNQQQCWKNEINPETNRIYETEEEWNQDLIFWEQKRPQNKPSMTELIHLYKVMKDEEDNFAKIKYDKVKHCYAGCRISGLINVSIAYFAAWEKEQIDLADCDIKSHFEVKDFEATIVGADYAFHEQTDTLKCVDFCKLSFPKYTIKL